jgi:rubredoxin
MEDSGTILANRSRCPRCKARSTIQSAVQLRPGVHYLTLRCISCGLVFDAQVGSEKADGIDPAG